MRVTLLVAATVLAALRALDVARRTARASHILRRIAVGQARQGGSDAPHLVGRRTRPSWSALVASASPTSPPRRLPEPPAWLVRRLDEAGLQLSPHLVWSGWILAVALGAVVGGAVAGLGLGLLATVGAIAAPVVVLRIARGRGDARYESSLPEVLDAVARALRSGGSLRQAIAEAAEAVPGPIGADLRDVALAATQGVPLVVALEGWAARRPLPAVRLAVAALCLGAETGGAQARAVDGVATTVRERLAVAGEVRALSSQARASALVMVASPLVFCLFSTATDARIAAFLFRTPLGLAFLGAGLGLDAVAGIWMARLSRVAA